MKTMKKLLALAMVLAMVMAMAVTAGAATITIENSLPDTTYKFYQLMTYEPPETTGSGIGWYKVVPELEAILSNYFEIRSDGYVVKKTYTGTDTQLANALMADLAGISAKYTCETTADGTYTFSDDVANGYYLMTSTKKGDPATLRENATLTLINGNLTIRDKNTDDGLPTVDKTMENDGKQYVINEERDFTIKVTTDEGHTKYTITDTMTNLALTSTVQLVGTLPEGATITSNNSAVGATGFEIVIDFAEGYKSVANQTITFQYTAKVLETGYDFIKNEVKVEGTDGTTPETDEDEVSDTQYDFTANKTDGKNVINGAEFVLKKVEDGVVQYAVFNSDSVLTGWAQHYEGDGCASHAADVKLGTVFAIGSKTMKGFAAGNYSLVEIKAPAGYKLPAAPNNETSVSIVVLETGYTVNSDSVNHTVSVVNTKLDKLPETGGMGTTLFYTMGGFLVLAAAAMVLTKKRGNA